MSTLAAERPAATPENTEKTMAALAELRKRTPQLDTNINDINIDYYFTNDELETNIGDIPYLIATKVAEKAKLSEPANSKFRAVLEARIAPYLGITPINSEECVTNIKVVQGTLTINIAKGNESKDNRQVSLTIFPQKIVAVTPPAGDQSIAPAKPAHQNVAGVVTPARESEAQPAEDQEAARESDDSINNLTEVGTRVHYNLGEYEKGGEKANFNSVNTLVGSVDATEFRAVKHPKQWCLDFIDGAKSFINTNQNILGPVAKQKFKELYNVINGISQVATGDDVSVDLQSFENSSVFTHDQIFGKDGAYNTILAYMRAIKNVNYSKTNIIEFRFGDAPKSRDDRYGAAYMTNEDAANLKQGEDKPVNGTKMGNNAGAGAPRQTTGGGADKPADEDEPAQPQQSQKKREPADSSPPVANSAAKQVSGSPRPDETKEKAKSAKKSTDQNIPPPADDGADSAGIGAEAKKPKEGKPSDSITPPAEGKGAAKEPATAKDQNSNDINEVHKALNDKNEAVRKIIGDIKDTINQNRNDIEKIDLSTENVFPWKNVMTANAEYDPTFTSLKTAADYTLLSINIPTSKVGANESATWTTDGLAGQEKRKTIKVFLLKFENTDLEHNKAAVIKTINDLIVYTEKESRSSQEAPKEMRLPVPERSLINVIGDKTDESGVKSIHYCAEKIGKIIYIDSHWSEKTTQSKTTEPWNKNEPVYVVKVKDGDKEYDASINIDRGGFCVSTKTSEGNLRKVYSPNLSNYDELRQFVIDANKNPTIKDAPENTPPSENEQIESEISEALNNGYLTGPDGLKSTFNITKGAKEGLFSIDFSKAKIPTYINGTRTDNESDITLNRIRQLLKFIADKNNDFYKEISNNKIEIETSLRKTDDDKLANIETYRERGYRAPYVEIRLINNKIFAVPYLKEVDGKFHAYKVDANPTNNPLRELKFTEEHAIIKDSLSELLNTINKEGALMKGSKPDNSNTYKGNLDSPEIEQPSEDKPSILAGLITAAPAPAPGSTAANKPAAATAPTPTPSLPTPSQANAPSSALAPAAPTEAPAPATPVSAPASQAAAEPSAPTTNAPSSAPLAAPTAPAEKSAEDMKHEKEAEIHKELDPRFEELSKVMIPMLKTKGFVPQNPEDELKGIAIERPKLGDAVYSQPYTKGELRVVFQADRDMFVVSVDNKKEFNHVIRYDVNNTIEQTAIVIGIMEKAADLTQKVDAIKALSAAKDYNISEPKGEGDEKFVVVRNKDISGIYIIELNATPDGNYFAFEVIGKGAKTYDQIDVRDDYIVKDRNKAIQGTSPANVAAKIFELRKSKQEGDGSTLENPPENK